MTALALYDRKTAVYRLFADGDTLLYVGITHDLKTRLSDHRCHKAWWPLINRASVDWCTNRAEALQQEAEAIGYERPIFNGLRPDPRRNRAVSMDSVTGPLPQPEHGADAECLGIAITGHIKAPIPDFSDMLRATFQRWQDDPTTHPTWGMAL